MRRSLVALLAIALLTLVTLAVPVAPADAAPGQEPDGPIEAPADDGTGGSAADEDDEPEPTPAVPEQDIIPQPNSGSEPTEAGDRGGALQIAVFVAIVAGLGTIVLLARREVLRSRSVRSTSTSRSASETRSVSTQAGTPATDGSPSDAVR